MLCQLNFVVVGVEILWYLISFPLFLWYLSEKSLHTKLVSSLGCKMLWDEKKKFAVQSLLNLDFFSWCLPQKNLRAEAWNLKNQFLWWWEEKSLNAYKRLCRRILEVKVYIFLKRIWKILNFVFKNFFCFLIFLGFRKIK